MNGPHIALNSSTLLSSRRTLIHSTHSPSYPTTTKKPGFFSVAGTKDSEASPHNASPLDSQRQRRFSVPSLS
ncbi:Pseudouridylate synthase 7 (Putative) (Silurana) [Caligus rogercresseyi]|uniref:Pseudouridylate synthase 7 (Putative) (Silurana) n=1 Tax=Caligus rogercresseyi TaxID=217165 RepID=A0A7T8QRZ1_CALRO|nr:Pseudouridylate synthase 7 (Putative) (Silurana) [Caligus rogercresseyi]